MNYKQRTKNRANADRLARIAHRLRLSRHVCENCGELGGHWIQTAPQSLDDILNGRPDAGFWTCPKYYGADGRRLPEHTSRTWSEPADALGMAALLVAEFQRDTAA